MCTHGIIIMISLKLYSCKFHKIGMYIVHCAHCKLLNKHGKKIEYLNFVHDV